MQASKPGHSWPGLPTLLQVPPVVGVFRLTVRGTQGPLKAWKRKGARGSQIFPSSPASRKLHATYQAYLGCSAFDPPRAELGQTPEFDAGATKALGTADFFEE
ncbi:hypothetical protein KM043_009490 [Ampulex compressa]|nr:hypothetical protein KM043_009490 [Ampulex compressa]